MKTISTNDLPLAIPDDVALCPICGAPLVVEDIDEWDAETGEVTEHGLHITCSKEPDIDSKGWNEWHNWHYKMPYVDWLPLQKPVREWFNAHYRMGRDDEMERLERWNKGLGLPAR